MIHPDFQLKKFNTFGLQAKAAFFIETESIDLLKEVLSRGLYSDYDENILVLGGGSNILFTGDYEGIIIHPTLTGIEYQPLDEERVVVKAAAGIVWDNLVQQTITDGFFGLENLSLIPGLVGASPIQNIGAYGVEASSLISKVNFLYLDSGREESLSARDCHFGYRDSIFKNSLKGKTIITSVEYILSRQFSPQLEYGDIKKNLEPGTKTTAAQVRKAVIDIRQSKLPDPAVTGNAGSFFRNPIITSDLYNDLQSTFSDLPGYDLGNGKVKVPAGWLIERSGWKGKRVGDAGVHDKQALVLVNHGNATGKDIYMLATEIIGDVSSKFRIVLETEVNVI